MTASYRESRSADHRYDYATDDNTAFKDRAINHYAGQLREKAAEVHDRDLDQYEKYVIAYEIERTAQTLEAELSGSDQAYPEFPDETESDYAMEHPEIAQAYSQVLETTDLATLIYQKAEREPSQDKAADLREQADYLMQGYQNPSEHGVHFPLETPEDVNRLVARYCAKNLLKYARELNGNISGYDNTPEEQRLVAERVEKDAKDLLRSVGRDEPDLPDDYSLPHGIENLPEMYQDASESYGRATQRMNFVNDLYRLAHQVPDMFPDSAEEQAAAVAAMRAAADKALSA